MNKVFCHFFLLFSVSCLIHMSCSKEIICDDPSASLAFSADTLLFDTVFTTFGSATRHFKVYNLSDRNLKIETIRLSGSEASPYRINVDGIAGRVFSDIILKRGDSLFVFAEVTIDPLDQDTPLIIEDSIIFITNGNVQNVSLVSWGQDVNIIRGEVFLTGTLKAGKSYLVYDRMVIDSGQVLTLEPGVRMHFHRNARIDVKGTLIAEGTRDLPIVFEGARTETGYRNVPGQWEGIRLMPSGSNNLLAHCRIRNAVNGITADTLLHAGTHKLFLSNSRIENMTWTGLHARSSSVYSYNTVFSNCGSSAISLEKQGNYEFYHCTVANYWTWSHRSTPSVIIHPSAAEASAMKVKFGNCIIHGLLENEVKFLNPPERGILFTHCLLSHTEVYPDHFIGCITGLDPEFEDRALFNFRPAEKSPVIDAGDRGIANMHPVDFDGVCRTSDQGPDIGAFERSR